jgi:hypothetical protein
MNKPYYIYTEHVSTGDALCSSIGIFVDVFRSNGKLSSCHFFNSKEDFFDFINGWDDEYYPKVLGEDYL